MVENNFIFTDLSTYNLRIARDFYSEVFNWEYQNYKDDYLIAEYDNKEISGLYETPEKFKNMNMPSFWMTYIRVENIDQTVEKAKVLGGIIELVDKDQSMGKIALIRDPLGAGFTIYEGNNLNSRFENQNNGMVWNELFISDFSKISAFYEGIFNWALVESRNHRYLIKNSKNDTIGAIQETSNEIKGNKEYWSVYFAVKNISETKSKVLKNGGKLAYEDKNTTALKDAFGAFFHIIPINSKLLIENNFEVKSRNKSIKRKAISGLMLIFLSFLTNWTWIWGIFFTLWVVSDIRSGRTHLFESITRKDDPFIYWVIIALWSFLAIYSFAYYSNIKM